MIPVTTFAGQQVAVFGLGSSGLLSARALAAGGADSRPELPRPKTATCCPAKVVTGIMSGAAFSPHLPRKGGGRRAKLVGRGVRFEILQPKDTPLPNPPPQGERE